MKEPTAVAVGVPRSGPVEGVEVRPLAEGDLEECGALCERVHGFPRTGELRDMLQAGGAFAAVRDGRITAYASNVAFWQMNHGVAEGDDDMTALLLGAAAATGDDRCRSSSRCGRRSFAGRSARGSGWSSR